MSSQFRACETRTGQARFLRLTASTGEIRTATYEDREHLVIPVIALVEGVIWASNASGPEYVPAEELAVAPAGWNGRPCMPGHPQAGSTATSANSPTMLEKNRLGQVFNARYAERKLHMEAWLDIARSEKVGEEGADILRRARAGEMIEVSIGAFITAEEKKGEYNGKEYVAVWHNIVPDHLALLPAGVEGACSNEMGCGAPRDAHAYRVNGDVLEPIHLRAAEAKPVERRSLRERMLSLLRFRHAEEGLSDVDLRMELERALGDKEPGFMGVERVWPDDGKVVYATYTQDTFHMYRRGYELDGKSVKLANDREEVEAELNYVPVNAAESAPSAAPTAACGCGGTTITATSEEKETMNKTERIKALLKKLRVKETPTVLAAYDAMSDETITALEAQEAEPVEEPKPTPAPAAAPVAAPAPVAAAAAPQPMSMDEYLRTAPAEVVGIVNRVRAADAARKAVLVSKLKTAQAEFTETELNTMELDTLERHARMLRVEVETPAAVGSVNFAARAAASSGAQESQAIPAPPDMVANIRAAANTKRTGIYTAEAIHSPLSQ